MRVLRSTDPELMAPPPSIELDDEASRKTCGALKDYWYVGCLSEELAERPLGRTIFGEKVVLWRDAQGTARAATDRCLHRGAALSEGVVVGGDLCCPYHGWSYGSDGRRSWVPSRGPDQHKGVLTDDDRRRLHVDQEPRGNKAPCLKLWATQEQDGLVFVYAGADPKEARRPPFRIPFWDDPSWTAYFMVTRFRNGVTHLVENFMDVPHTTFVHQGWFRTKVVPKRVPASVDLDGEEVLVTYRQERDRISGLGVVLNPTGEAMVHTDRFIAPNVTRVDYSFGPVSTGRGGGFAICSQCTPVGPRETLVFTSISYKLPLELPRRLVGRALKPVMQWYTRQVINQDVEVMDTQTAGLTADDTPPVFLNTEADVLHVQIERLRAWLREGGRGTKPDDERIETAFYI